MKRHADFFDSISARTFPARQFPQNGALCARLFPLRRRTTPLFGICMQPVCDSVYIRVCSCSSGCSISIKIHRRFQEDWPRSLSKEATMELLSRKAGGPPCRKLVHTHTHTYNTTQPCANKSLGCKIRSNLATFSLINDCKAFIHF
jgi:hypothetical protein